MNKKLKKKISQRSGIVALIGRPNVGKSTLLNQILEEKISIVSRVPQTTRFSLRGIYTDHRGQLVLVDTPGIHIDKDVLSKRLNTLAEESMIDADVIVYIVDLHRTPKEEEIRIINRLSTLNVPIIMALNKMDAGKGYVDRFMALWESVPGDNRPLYYIPTSALKRKNIDRLLQVLFETVPEGPHLFPDDVLTDFPQKLAAADVIREKLLHVLTKELPHDIAVSIDSFERKGEGLLIIYASIYVRRDSQKGIVIGKKGQVLKNIGARARKELEEIHGKRIFLDIRVKVESKWREKENLLKQFGYSGLE